MNITAHSSTLTLLFAWTFLWILMDVQYHKLTSTQKRLFPILFVAITLCNELLRLYLGGTLYKSSLIFTMHLPTFFLFRYLTGQSVVKLIFMVLTTLVFTAPTVLLSNILRELSLANYTTVLFISNLISFGITLLIAYFVFRKGFHYLLKYGDDRLFLLLSTVPLLYYVYVFTVANLDFSMLMHSPKGYFVRYTPTLEVFVFYFMIPYLYKYLSEKKDLEHAQAILYQELDASRERLALMNESQAQIAIYRHDMRHHIMALEGLFHDDKSEEAIQYIKKIYTDIETISPKRFCKNEIVNLLLSSFYEKAQRMQIQLNITALLPQTLSIPDPELCAMLSNGLENALHAVSELNAPFRTVEFYCEYKQNKLLVEIRNPYIHEVTIENGIPVSGKPGHGYGCKSIASIAQKHRGICTFHTEENTFILRIVLPIETT